MGKTGSRLEGHELFMINVLLEEDAFQAGFMRLLLGGVKEQSRNDGGDMVRTLFRCCLLTGLDKVIVQKRILFS